MQPNAIAYYIGSQETERAPIALFNLLVSLPGHPEESTVSAQTLRAHGYYVPREMAIGQRLTLSRAESFALLLTA